MFDNNLHDIGDEFSKIDDLYKRHACVMRGSYYIRHTTCFILELLMFGTSSCDFVCYDGESCHQHILHHDDDRIS